MKKGPIITFTIILLLLAAVAYWQFFMRSTPQNTPDDTGQSTGFTPLDRPGSSTGGGQQVPVGTNGSTTTSSSGQAAKIPALRLLSDTPVGGYGASTTGPVGAKPASTTTAIRWVDRGRGNILEAFGNTLDITTISNTVVPKIYESMWNKNLTSFVALTLPEGGIAINGLYAELRMRALPKLATSTASSSTPAPATSSSLTPFELKGKNLPANIIAYAVSPKRDRLFMLVDQNGTGVGYTSAFDGTAPVQIFTTPLTQVNVEWPSDNVIAITTKGSADQRGYLYFVDPKTGVWKKILGPLPGLSTKVSTDAKRVLISMAGSANNVVTSIITLATNTGTDAVFRTIADKCVWGNFYKEMVYCAVPSQSIAGTYPDDWYTGAIAFTDKIWQENAATGEIKLVSSITDTSDRIIDAFNLGLDDKDDFLIFMNKNDLSLWSLDLVAN